MNSRDWTSGSNIRDPEEREWVEVLKKQVFSELKKQVFSEMKAGRGAFLVDKGKVARDAAARAKANLDHMSLEDMTDLYNALVERLAGK